MFKNLEFYAFHPYIVEKTGFFHNENNAFSAAVSDAALADGYNRNNPSSRMVVVKREAIRNATSGNYASLLCMLALSSVTGMDITSVYPETTGKETKYSQMQNGAIHPRRSHGLFTGNLVQEVRLVILWSRDGIDVLPGLQTTFQPNHFVPLVEYNTKGQQIHHGGLSRSFQSKAPKVQQQLTITDLLKPSNTDKNTSKGKYITQM